MKVTPTALSDVLVIEPSIHTDERGLFFESFNQRDFENATGIAARFVQDNYSHSLKHVLRGMHYQLKQPQGKLVQVVNGTILDVAIDLRRSSPHFKRSVVIELSSEKHRQLWIPPGFAHGFLVLSEFADVVYKTTDYYAIAHERCIHWNDSVLAIDWPIGVVPLLSDKDCHGVRFADAELPD